MITVQKNTADQQIYCTLRERVGEIPDWTHYLFELTEMQTDQKRYFVADVQADNERYTQIRMSTDANEPTSGNLLLDTHGQHRYVVYGQTSGTNLDPEDASVQGVIEKGVLEVKTNESYTTDDNPEVPANVTYNG